MLCAAAVPAYAGTAKLTGTVTITADRITKTAVRLVKPLTLDLRDLHIEGGGSDTAFLLMPVSGRAPVAGFFTWDDGQRHYAAGGATPRLPAGRYWLLVCRDSGHVTFSMPASASFSWHPTTPMEALSDTVHPDVPTSTAATGTTFAEARSHDSAVLLVVDYQILSGGETVTACLAVDTPDAGCPGFYKRSQSTKHKDNGVTTGTMVALVVRPPAEALEGFWSVAPTRVGVVTSLSGWTLSLG